MFWSETTQQKRSCLSGSSKPFFDSVLICLRSLQDASPVCWLQRKGKLERRRNAKILAPISKIQKSSLNYLLPWRDCGCHTLTLRAWPSCTSGSTLSKGHQMCATCLSQTARWQWLHFGMLAGLCSSTFQNRGAQLMMNTTPPFDNSSEQHISRRD